MTALRLVNSGKLKAQKIGRQWWINEEDFIAFLQGESKRKKIGSLASNL